VAFVGAMFAEKTSVLFGFLNRHARAGQKVILFRPKRDTRGKIPQTHDGGGLIIEKFGGEIIRVSTCKEVLSLALNKKAQVVGIDESQFLPSNLIKILVRLYEHSITVYLSALDTDYRARNFKTISEITKHPLVYTTKLTAICNFCHSHDGVYSLRFDEKGNVIKKDIKRIIIGDKIYQPACHKCRRRILKRKKKK
jgi:thymidine kinase